MKTSPFIPFCVFNADGGGIEEEAYRARPATALQNGPFWLGFGKAQVSKGRRVCFALPALSVGDQTMCGDRFGRSHAVMILKTMKL